MTNPHVWNYKERQYLTDKKDKKAFLLHMNIIFLNPIGGPHSRRTANKNLATILIYCTCITYWPKL